MKDVLDYLRSALIRKDGAGLTDGQLLSRFAALREEAAFVALVRRHGRMVLGVCRRLLRNEHDAEDAFQAVFLVLARKASSVEPREAVGNWLYGVAYRTALEARTMINRRRAKERSFRELAERTVDSRGHAELHEVLDRALSRLPDKYRLPLVLCELEGRTRREVARQLGLPEGTLSSRLAMGRKILAKRLSRYAPELAETALAAILAESAGAAIPIGLAGFTAKAAIMVTTAPAVSASVLALAEGVVKAMLISKLKMAGVFVLIVGSVIGTTACGVAYRLNAGEQETAPRQVQIKRDAVPPAQTTPAQLAETEARLQAEIDDAEGNAVRLMGVAYHLKAKLNDLRRQREEREADAAVQHNAQAMASLARRFRYRVPVEIGLSEFKESGRLEILEIWGTRPKIEVGGHYLVRGKYVLPHEGKLYFYETAAGNQDGATLDLQMTQLPKGQGEFTLVHGMALPGSFHLILTASDDYSHAFANVYFGTGDNVRRKPW